MDEGLKEVLDKLPREFQPEECTIPYLKEKTRYLLKSLGCTQSWLARQMGWKGPSRVTQILNAGAVPAHQYHRWCKTLAVGRAELKLASYEEFVAAMESTLAKRTGRRWKIFANEYGYKGVKIGFSTARERTPGTQISYLKGLYQNDDSATSHHYERPVVRKGEKIFFEIPLTAIRLPDHISPQTYLILLDARENSCIEYLAPPSQPDPPKTHSGSYLFTSEDGKGYRLGAPYGSHTLYIILMSENLPQDIVEHFLSGRAGIGADRLAEWLKENSDIKFSLHVSEFFVSPR